MTRLTGVAACVIGLVVLWSPKVAAFDIGAAVLAWWPLTSRMPELPPLAPGLQLLYVLVLGAPMVVVAAFVTLADTVLYPHYAAAPRLFGITALEDQRMGGTIMWVPAHVIFVIPFTMAFFRWVRAELADDER